MKRSLLLFAQKRECRKRKQDYEILAALEPLVIEKRAYEKVLENESGQFPVNGMARYEAIKAKWSRFSCKLIHFIKIENVQSEIESIQIDEEFYKRKLCRRTSYAAYVV